MKGFCRICGTVQKDARDGLCFMHRNAHLGKEYHPISVNPFGRRGLAKKRRR